MKYIIYTLLILITLYGCRKSDFVLSEDYQDIISDNGAGIGTVTLTKDKEHILKGLVFVNDGQVLTIEAGTVIKAYPGDGDKASALIVARGGKIIAQGTEEEPIIFTSENDDLNGSVGLKEKGLWGGVIILGDAPIKSQEKLIEGIPIYEPRGVYGGDNAEDNSGILSYVSIRHGGTKIGDGNEINGLTLGGVGSGTTIDHVEVIANMDDGIEFFGGSVNCKNLIVSYCGDDAYDFDEGYNGSCQFIVGIQDEDGDLLAEHSEDNLSGATPYIYNATFIGCGNDDWLVKFSDNGAGVYGNSIFANKQKGILINDNASYNQFINRRTALYNNVFSDIAENTLGSSLSVNINGEFNQDARNEFVYQSFINKCIAEDIGVTASDTLIKLTPDYVAGDIHLPPTSWFDEVGYKGAVGTLKNWTKGWTLIGEYIE